MPHLLTIAGSLRVDSSNAALLAAAILLAPEGVTTESYTELAALPAFNPDVEESGVLPAAVARWRAALGRADGVLISSPEYAHGIPGALKNALDWAVGGSEMIGKRVGLLNASAASRFAHPQLIEVLTVMSANVIPEASVLLDIPRRGATAESLAADRMIAARIGEVLGAVLSL